VAKGIPIPDNIGELFALPSAEEYRLSINGYDATGQYIIVAAQSVKTADQSLYNFWIDRNEWIAKKIYVYDQKGTALYTISYNSIRRNGNLKERDLRRLPPGTEVNDWT
jgi:outer membrane lipoprotein-sorting protein